VLRSLVLRFTPGRGSVALSKSNLQSLGFNSNPPYAPSFHVPRSALSGNAEYQQSRSIKVMSLLRRSAANALQSPLSAVNEGQVFLPNRAEKNEGLENPIFFIT